MGGSSSKSAAQKEADPPVPDFVYKNKPFPGELPEWFTSIRVKGDPVPHLRKTVNERTQKGEIRYQVDLPQSKTDAEVARRAALDCSKRCLHSKIDYEARAEEDPNGEHKLFRYAEQVCLNRCLNKYLQAKVVVDSKVRGQV